MSTAQQIDVLERHDDVATTNVDPMISMIERVVCDPNASVEKLERMLAMKERLEDRAREEEARAQVKAYHQAMAICQSQLKVVAKNKSNSQTHSTYADLAALSKAADPVIHKNGFSLSFAPAGIAENGDQLLEWTIAHSEGHIKTGVAAIPSDKAGAQGKVNKTNMHAFGSSITYGRRYLKLMLFDIATGDDDGNAAGSTLITDEQVDELIELADSLDVDKAGFCKWAQIESFSDIRVTDFQKAKSAILAKGKKATKKDHDE